MERIKELPPEGAKFNLIKIIKGSGFSILITIILLLIYSCLLTYTNLHENTMPTVIIIISALSILVGSFFSSLHIKKNGIINGALVGLVYIVVIYLLSSMISGNFGFTTLSLIITVSSIAAGAIGGIIGVNR